MIPNEWLFRHLSFNFISDDIASCNLRKRGLNQPASLSRTRVGANPNDRFGKRGRSMCQLQRRFKLFDLYDSLYARSGSCVTRYIWAEERSKDIRVKKKKKKKTALLHSFVLSSSKPQRGLDALNSNQYRWANTRRERQRYHTPSRSGQYTPLRQTSLVQTGIVG